MGVPGIIWGIIPLLPQFGCKIFRLERVTAE